MAMGIDVSTDSRANLEADLNRDYVKNKFACPAQETMMRGCSQIGPGWSSPLEYTSYVFNEALTGRREVRPDRSPAIRGNLAKVRHASDVFFAADGRPRGHIDGEAITIPNAGDHDTLHSFVQLTTWGPDAARGHLDYPRHGFRINVVFADGHADSVLMTDPGLATIGISEGIYN
jgi:prepilin-type processing-associated H-X9-DG protein